MTYNLETIPFENQPYLASTKCSFNVFVVFLQNSNFQKVTKNPRSSVLKKIIFKIENFQKYIFKIHSYEPLKNQKPSVLRVLRVFKKYCLKIHDYCHESP